MANVHIRVVDKKQKPLEGIVIEAEFLNEVEDQWLGTTTINTDYNGYAHLKDYDTRWSFFLSIEGEQYGKFSYSNSNILITKSNGGENGYIA